MKYFLKGLFLGLFLTMTTTAFAQAPKLSGELLETKEKNKKKTELYWDNQYIGFHRISEKRKIDAMHDSRIDNTAEYKISDERFILVVKPRERLIELLYQDEKILNWYWLELYNDFELRYNDFEIVYQGDQIMIFRGGKLKYKGETQ